MCKLCEKKMQNGILKMLSWSDLSVLRNHRGKKRNHFYFLSLFLAVGYMYLEWSRLKAESNQAAVAKYRVIASPSLHLTSFSTPMPWNLEFVNKGSEGMKPGRC